MKRHALVVAALGVGATACGGSLDSAIARGEYYRACEATDAGYSRKLADTLAEKSGATLAITPWRSVDALSSAQVPSAKDTGWSALALELGMPKKSEANELAEVFVSSPVLRFSGWQSRAAVGLGDAYRLITGNSLPSPGTAASLDDIGSWARGVITGDAAARAKLESAFSSASMPDDAALAERLSELFASECRAVPSSRCRVASMLVPSPPAPQAKPAVAFTLRYAVEDRQSGAHCLQVEHVVVPLAAGSDLPSALAATFKGNDVALTALRAKARVYGMTAEDPFFEDEHGGNAP